jgi:hypothetical protein
MPNPPPFLPTKSLISWSWLSVNWRGSTVAEQDDVVVQQLLDALGEPPDRAGELVGGRVPLLGEAGVGAGEQATDQDRPVADHVVLDVAVLPAGVPVDVEDRDLRVEDRDRGRAGVVVGIELARLLLDFGDHVERALALGLEENFLLDGLVVGERDDLLGRAAVGGAEGAPVFLSFSVSLTCLPGS